MNAAKSNQNIMICVEELLALFFGPNFFHYAFRRGSRNEIKSRGEHGTVKSKRRKKIVNKNAIKGVNKRIFFVFSL